MAEDTRILPEGLDRSFPRVRAKTRPAHGPFVLSLPSAVALGPMEIALCPSECRQDSTTKGQPTDPGTNLHDIWMREATAVRRPTRGYPALLGHIDPNPIAGAPVTHAAGAHPSALATFSGVRATPTASSFELLRQFRPLQCHVSRPLQCSACVCHVHLCSPKDPNLPRRLQAYLVEHTHTFSFPLTSPHLLYSTPLTTSLTLLTVPHHTPSQRPHTLYQGVSTRKSSAISFACTSPQHDTKRQLTLQRK
jgi:hypothetical protein